MVGFHSTFPSINEPRSGIPPPENAKPRPQITHKNLKHPRRHMDKTQTLQRLNPKTKTIQKHNSSSPHTNLNNQPTNKIVIKYDGINSILFIHI